MCPLFVTAFVYTLPIDGMVLAALPETSDTPLVTIPNQVYIHLQLILYCNKYVLTNSKRSGAVCIQC